MVTDSAAIPYKTFARKESHPARIGAIARLYGLHAEPANSCSVLELGCGDGRNIIPIAAVNPDSRFTGVDYSRELVEKGRSECADLELSNVELIHADMSEYNPPREEFDYIICHGVYSWVSSELQRRILELCKRALAPHGVIFMSYNTLPGWRQRGVVRDILRVGSLLSKEESQEQRCKAGLSLLDRLTKEPNISPYVRESAGRLAQSELSYIYQEFLGEYNTPQLFVDFMQSAQGEGLQYLSEARVVMMSSDDLSVETNEFLDSFGDDVWMREQVLDLIRNRTFRETLLCHGGHVLKRGLSTHAFKELVFVSNYIPIGEVDKDDPSGAPFVERLSTREIRVPHGECEKIMALLARIGVQGATIAEISNQAAVGLGMTEHDTMRAIVTLWRSGFVDGLQMSLCGKSSFAVAPNLSIRQAAAGERVTSLLHESLDLSALERKALSLSDGAISFEELEHSLRAHASPHEAQVAIRNLRDRGFFL